MNIPVKDVPNFIKFCADNKIDLAKEPELVQQLVLQEYLKSKEDFKDWSPNDNKVVNVVKVGAVKPVKAVVAAQNTKFADGVYELGGRISFTQSGEVDYKATLFGVDPKSLGRSYIPIITCSKLEDKSSKTITAFLKKMWKANRSAFRKVESHTKGGQMERGYYDTIVSIGSAHVTVKGGSIKSLSKVELKRDLIEVSTPAPATKPTVPTVVKAVQPAPKAPVPAAAPPPVGLASFQVTISKHDPMFVNDPMMALYKYNPHDRFILRVKEIMGRIGEIVFHSQNPSWVWNNSTCNNSEHFDFERAGTDYTLDIKTTNHEDNNLLIEKKKVDLNKMAKYFALCIVLDKGDSFDVRFVGFISSSSALAYIGAFPGCLMGKTYKIRREYLEPKI